jgi:hemerythrin-like domain-containing protein
MKPTEILSGEHRVIEKVLECLETMADLCENRGTLDFQDAADAISFFQTFADRCHHGKEEAHLFPAMEAKGYSREGGPTGVMLHEHEQGRILIRRMAARLAAASDGDRGAQAEFIEAAREYVELLRQHIQKEDHCLFAMADRAFDDQDQQRLLDAFERVEREHAGEGTHEKYLQLARILAYRYNVAGDSPGVGQIPACRCGG